MKPSSKDPRTCSADGCDHKHLAQGFCRNHYNVARKNGTLPGVDHSAEHWMSEVDATARTARCSICGPVEKIWRKSAGGFRCPIKARRDKAEINSRPKVKAYHAQYAKARRFDIRLSKYNLTRDQFDALVAECESACLICRIPLTIAEMHIDHDHACCSGHKTCGQCVRGILCRYCNHGLGNFKDSPARLSAAIAYLAS